MRRSSGVSRADPLTIGEPLGLKGSRIPRSRGSCYQPFSERMLYAFCRSLASGARGNASLERGGCFSLRSPANMLAERVLAPLCFACLSSFVLGFAMSRLAHHVFFTLKDNSPSAVDALLADCKEYLDNHDGVVDFSVGRRDPELNRPVNASFDVSLHVVFKDRATHDVYQTAPRHLEFIERNKESWAEVMVCDSNLDD